MGTLDARKEFDKKAAIWQGNVDTLASELQRYMQDFEQQKATMTEKEIELNTQLINSKQQQFIQYREVMGSKIREEELKITKEILEEINIVVKEYAKTNNYHLVFGVSGQGNVVYAEEYLNITDKVLEILNNNYSRNSPN